MYNFLIHHLSCTSVPFNSLREIESVITHNQKFGLAIVGMRLSAPLHSEYIVPYYLGLFPHETDLGLTLTSQALLPSLTGLEGQTEGPSVTFCRMKVCLILQEKLDEIRE
jgi:hypothetical protein